MLDNESHFAAIMRELKEELGVSAAPLRDAIPTEIHTSGDYPLSISFIETELYNEPVMLEHENMGWFTATELLQLELAPADAEFAAKYFNEQ